MNTEADTCRKFIVPKLQAAGWDDAPCAIQEQRSFTDGRVVLVGGVPRRGVRKRADYILRYRADYPIAVIEAKAGTLSKSTSPSVRKFSAPIFLHPVNFGLAMERSYRCPAR